VKIINLSKNRILADQATVAAGFLGRVKGLIGLKELKPKEGLIIDPCKGVHTIFMSFPIDCIFLDQENRVKKIIKSLKPYRFSPICFFSKLVIELPVGSIQDSLTEEGDRISFL